MFSFLKRLFGIKPEVAPKRRVVLPETTPAPVAPIADAPISVAPVPVAPAPTEYAARAPEVATISQEALNVVFWDDDVEPVDLPGDRADLGMVPSIGNPNAYMVGLVGEQHHAAAVSALVEGMEVYLQLEPGNPDDPSAIAAVDAHDRVIGYISQDSWLRQAVYGGGSGFNARVLATEVGDRGYREVVLEVEPSEEALGERAYQG